MFNLKKVLEQQEQPTVNEGELKGRIIEMLRTIYDPEIPVNIYDLGLVYGIDIDADNRVQIRMTLTAPNCPVAQSFPQTVQDAVMCVADVSEVNVELVWEPAWTRESMSEAAKLQLGML